MQSRVRMHTWRTCLKKRALTNQVRKEQVNPNPIRYPNPCPNPIPYRNSYRVSFSNPQPKPKPYPNPNPKSVETHGGNAG
jgi:hypothetical protein